MLYVYCIDVEYPYTYMVQIEAENERLQGLSMMTSSSVGQEDYNEYQASLARNVQLQFSIMDPSPPHPADHVETDYHIIPRKPFHLGYVLMYRWSTYIYLFHFDFCLSLFMTLYIFGVSS